MKYLLRILLTFAAVLTAGAVDKVRVPVNFPDPGAVFEQRSFCFGIPLRRGAIRDVKNFQLVTAENREIPIQCRPAAFWDDGSLRWLSVSGFLPPGNGERTFFAEYGSSVLQLLPPGIIRASADGKMLVDAGPVTARFDLKNFAAPEKITFKDTETGLFVPGKFPEGAPQITVIEPGPRTLVLEFRAPGKEICGYRIHFYHGQPRLKIVEFGKKPDKLKVAEHKFHFTEKRTPVTRTLNFTFEGEIQPDLPPLYGVIDRDYLHRNSFFPGAAVILPPELAAGEKLLWEKLLALPQNTAHIPAMVTAFIRSGNPEFLDRVKAVTTTAALETDITGIIQAYGGFTAGSTPVPPDLPPFKKDAGTMETAELVRYARGNSPESRRCRELLIHCFDHRMSQWYDRIDLNGRSASAQPAPALLQLELALLLADDDKGRACANAIYEYRAGIGGFSDPELYVPLLKLAAIHGDFSLKDSLKRRSREFRPLKMRLQPGDELLFVRQPGENTPVDFTVPPETRENFRRSVDNPAGYERLHWNGKEAVTISLAPDTLPRLRPIPGKSRWELVAPAACRINFDIPPGMEKFSFFFRHLDTGGFATLLLISPDGEIKLQHTDRNPDGSGWLTTPPLTVTSPVPGKWGLIVNAPGQTALVF